jgi:hypothetical protein
MRNFKVFVYIQRQFEIGYYKRVISLLRLADAFTLNLISGTRNTGSKSNLLGLCYIYYGRSYLKVMLVLC